MGGCEENLLHPYCTIGQTLPDVLLSVTPPLYGALLEIMWMTILIEQFITPLIQLFDNAGPICWSWV